MSWEPTPGPGVVCPPSCLWVPPGAVGTYGDDVAEVAENVGLALYPEQKLAIDALVAHDRRGRFVTIEAGIEMGRQNGKTRAVLKPILLWTALTDPDHITWTSHELDSVEREFADIAGVGEDDEDALINRCDWLRRRVRKVVRENGASAVHFTSGATWDFRARSGRRGRGGSGATRVIDEALYWGASEAGALLPSLATRSLHGNARAYYASSAAKADSVVLRSLRRRALARDPLLTWVGWWADGSWDAPGCLDPDCRHAVGVQGCSLDNLDLLAQANPLYGRSTSAGFFATMRKTLEASPVEFGREFLGWEEGGDQVVTAVDWLALVDEDSKPLPSPVSVAVDVAPRFSAAAVVAAGRRADGLLHVEVLAARPGTAWLRGALAQIHREWGVPVRHLGGRVPIAGLLGDLAEVVDLEKVADVDWAAACLATEGALTSGQLRHLGDPALARAWASAVRRTTGDGSWVLSRRLSAGDISPAVALTLAVGGLADAPAPFVF